MQSTKMDNPGTQVSTTNNVKKFLGIICCYGNYSRIIRLIRVSNFEQTSALPISPLSPSN